MYIEFIIFSCIDNSCYHDTLYCRDGDYCEIKCLQNSDCTWVDFQCPDSANCAVFCDGADVYEICRESNVYCPSNTGQCQIDCTHGSETCKDMDIICDDDNPDNIIIECESSDGDLCDGLTISCKSGANTCTCKEGVQCIGNRCPPELSQAVGYVTFVLPYT